eukprot:6790345-Pyramimonas_sp.AAC.1
MGRRAFLSRLPPLLGDRVLAGDLPADPGAELRRHHGPTSGGHARDIVVLVSVGLVAELGTEDLVAVAFLAQLQLADHQLQCSEIADVRLIVAQR